MNYDHWRNYARGWVFHFIGKPDIAYAAYAEAFRIDPRDARPARHLAALSADRQRWDYNQNAPWANLERYAAIVNGLPDFSGSSQTSPVQQSNRLMSGLGGGLAGAGAAQALGLAGPWGWALGGLGALGGLFG